MPQHTCFVLDDADVGRDVDGVILDKRTGGALPRLLKHPPQLKESREAPVTLLLGESMVGGMMLQDRGVVDVPHHQAKLDTATPIVRDAVRIFKAVLQVYRSLVYIIPERKE